MTQNKTLLWHTLVTHMLLQSMSALECMLWDYQSYITLSCFILRVSAIRTMHIVMWQWQTLAILWVIPWDDTRTVGNGCSVGRKMTQFPDLIVSLTKLQQRSRVSVGFILAPLHHRSCSILLRFIFLVNCNWSLLKVFKHHFNMLRQGWLSHCPLSWGASYCLRRSHVVYRGFHSPLCPDRFTSRSYSLLKTNRN